MEPIIKEAIAKMNKSIEAFRHELSKVRTGKATTAILDGIKVDYYGTLTPLKQMANVSVLDAHTLSISPWDRSAINAIDKAIMQADLGLNPQNDGTNIKVPIPPLTEERRKEFVKLVKKFGEDAKIAIRNIRRDANEHLKKKQKDEKISEDLLKEAEAKVQKATNEHITEIDQILVHKEKEIMEV
ncbi:MAG: ribosome recycling factor [Ignavibacteriales bacterium]|jgi:ribosome recycling factor|nr:ribosome recycling factor [Ignavibacteriales bacterium]MBP7542818.1 ribosome recycling factor [Ignavibacteriaceae bacterium]MBK7266053.1 ribosome recycling factor [Ignavibacteriales bacterium]MBK8663956.1 ribosome recycling factor [Ignavibacteriales bacterium]MBP9121933.1 ribosome recycling factor [Ignavibacteriaceae bacterium]